MTESELFGSNFDWNGCSPGVYCRPMNPGLSAQQSVFDESPLFMNEKEHWVSKGGLLLTPVTPHVNGWSYLSQEESSSHFSVLNNAIIMDEDEIETIPTDEKQSQPRGNVYFREDGYGRQRDDAASWKQSVVNFEPILVNEDSVQLAAAHQQEKSSISSFNVSDLIPSIQNNSSASAITEGDQTNSLLQEFLHPIHENQKSAIEPVPLVPSGVMHIGAGSPSGPQWSPGIRRRDDDLDNLCKSSSDNPNLNNSSHQIMERTIRIEQTLHCLDGSPVCEEETSGIVLGLYKEDLAHDTLKKVFSRKPSSPVRLMGHTRSGTGLFTDSTEVSLLRPSSRGLTRTDNNLNRSVTQRRSASCGPRAVHQSVIDTTHLPNKQHNSFQNSFSSKASQRVVSHLSSLEREIQEAEEGKRRLMAEIQRNRINFEKIQRSLTPVPPQRLQRKPSSSLDHIFKLPGIPASVNHTARRVSSMDNSALSTVFGDTTRITGVCSKEALGRPRIHPTEQRSVLFTTGFVKNSSMYKDITANVPSLVTARKVAAVAPPGGDNLNRSGLGQPVFRANAVGVERTVHYTPHSLSTRRPISTANTSTMRSLSASTRPAWR